MESIRLKKYPVLQDDQYKNQTNTINPYLIMVLYFLIFAMMKLQLVMARHILFQSKLLLLIRIQDCFIIKDVHPWAMIACSHWSMASVKKTE